jgi:hypothetical protein
MTGGRSRLRELALAAWDVHWGTVSTIERVTIQAARLVTRPELLHGTGAPA